VGPESTPPDGGVIPDFGVYAHVVDRAHRPRRPYVFSDMLSGGNRRSQPEPAGWTRRIPTASCSCRRRRSHRRPVSIDRDARSKPDTAINVGQHDFYIVLCELYLILEVFYGPVVGVTFPPFGWIQQQPQVHTVTASPGRLVVNAQFAGSAPVLVVNGPVTPVAVGLLRGHANQDTGHVSVSFSGPAASIDPVAGAPRHTTRNTFPEKPQDNDQAIAIVDAQTRA
jgi:hypothetical protein